MRKEKTNRTGNAVYTGDGDLGSIVERPIGLNAEVAQPLAG